MTPSTGTGAATPSRRRFVVGTDPTASMPRQLAALVWLPVVVAVVLFERTSPVRPVWVLVVGLLLGSVGWIAVAFRIVRPAWVLPVAVLSLIAGGALLLHGAGTWSTAAAFPFVGAHLAGTRLSLRYAAALSALAAGAVVAALAPYSSPWDPVVIVVGVAASLLLGMVRRDSARRGEERERALVADARAREEHARAEAIADRARVARDVHDVLAHSLSALAVQLQGARLMAQRDGAAADTIAQIERAQRLTGDGISEARRAVRALREGPDPVDVVAELRALARDHPHATVDADRDVPLGPREGETVLRTAQEALTNARKHAPGAPVTVRLRPDGDGAELEVVDVAGEPPAGGDGRGSGLIGMAERAALVGADLDVGPTADGWRVALRVPRSRGGTDGTDPGGAARE